MLLCVVVLIVNDNGKICLSILDRDYNANDTVNYLLEAIIGLLLAPNPQDPIDIKRGEICKPENQKQYQSKIEEYNRDIWHLRKIHGAVYTIIYVHHILYMISILTIFILSLLQEQKW